MCFNRPGLIKLYHSSSRNKGVPVSLAANLTPLEPNDHFKVNNTSRIVFSLFFFLPSRWYFVGWNKQTKKKRRWRRRRRRRRKRKNKNKNKNEKKKKKKKKEREKVIAGWLASFLAVAVCLVLLRSPPRRRQALALFVLLFERKKTATAPPPPPRHGATHPPVCVLVCIYVCTLSITHTHKHMVS